jgi:predicted RNase H-like HicB family nuclease
MFVLGAAVGYNGDGDQSMDEVAIRLHIEPLEEGGFVATSPDVPGLVAEGRSVTEAMEIAQDLARKIAESCVEHGDALPPALQSLSSKPVALDLLVPVGIR